MKSKLGVIPARRTFSVTRTRSRLGDCVSDFCHKNDCPAGFRRVFGQCILDAPQATTFFTMASRAAGRLNR